MSSIVITCTTKRVTRTSLFAISFTQCFGTISSSDLFPSSARFTAHTPFSPARPTWLLKLILTSTNLLVNSQSLFLGLLLLSYQLQNIVVFNTVLLLLEVIIKIAIKCIYPPKITSIQGHLTWQLFQYLMLFTQLLLKTYLLT